MTPEQRTLRAQLAAYTRWSKTPDTVSALAPARAGYMARWENEVDPDRKLSPGDRARLARSAMKAHMARMSLKSSQARTA